MPSMTFYGKPGCHLCDDAREVVERVRATHSFDLTEVDVSLDPLLHRRYGERIPVLELMHARLRELTHGAEPSSGDPANTPGAIPPPD